MTTHQYLVAIQDSTVTWEPLQEYLQIHTRARWVTWYIHLTEIPFSRRQHSRLVLRMHQRFSSLSTILIQVLSLHSTLRLEPRLPLQDQSQHFTRLILQRRISASLERQIQQPSHSWQMASSSHSCHT